MSYDYYAEARSIAEALKQEGLSNWGSKILSAIDEGVTATEILMILRWNLENFISSQLGSENIVERAKLLYQKIDSVLS
jgi:hypothetical protein